MTFCFICASVCLRESQQKCLCDLVIVKNFGCTSERDCDAFFSLPKSWAHYVLHNPLIRDRWFFKNTMLTDFPHFPPQLHRRRSRR